MQETADPNTLFIWAAALPVSKEVRGGMILQEINFLADILRYDVLLVNHTASRAAVQYGFDVLNLHTPYVDTSRGVCTTAYTGTRLLPAI